MLLQDQAWHPSPDCQGSVAVDRDEAERSVGVSNVHTAVMKTLVGLFYGLSNQFLDNTGREILLSIIDAPSWNAVVHHLRDVLSMIDVKIVQAIAECLLKESISTCHQRMLDLSLSLGADPTQRIEYWDTYKKQYVVSTPLTALCSSYSGGLLQGLRKPSPEKLILSLLKVGPLNPDSTLLQTIRASCHAIAEEVSRRQPGQAMSSAVAAPDLEGGS